MHLQSQGNTRNSMQRNESSENSTRPRRINTQHNKQGNKSQRDDLNMSAIQEKRAQQFSDLSNPVSSRRDEHQVSHDTTERTGQMQARGIFQDKKVSALANETPDNSFLMKNFDNINPQISVISAARFSQQNQNMQNQQQASNSANGLNMFVSTQTARLT